MSGDRVPDILLIEDDPDTGQLIRETLTDHFGEDRVCHVTCRADALAEDPARFDLVLSDLNLPDGSGLEAIDALLQQRKDLPIVMVTSESDLETATEAIRRGAYDYMVKAGDYLFAIPLVVEKNLATWRTKVENLRLQEELERTLAQLRSKNEQLEEAVNQLERQALTDPLTGLANRRHIQTALERSFAEARRHGTDLAVLMVDLDGFKPFNDAFGHQAGDQMLRTMAHVLEANCRQSDVAGRYGGDEFVVLLPKTDPEKAEQVARRIQDQFRRDAQARFGRQVGCNLSIGIACASTSRPASADQLVSLADAGLYRAKDSPEASIFVHEQTSDRTDEAGYRACSQQTATDDGAPGVEHAAS